MKSRILLQYKYRFVYIALSLVLLVLVLNSLWYLLLVPGFFIYMHKNHKDMITIVLIILLIYGISIGNIESKNDLEGAQFDVKVNKVFDKKDYQVIEGTIEDQLVKVYINSLTPIRPGETYNITGRLESPIANTIPNSFNYKNYLKSKKISYILYAEETKYIKSEFSIYLLPYYIERYIEKFHPLSKSYIKTFILANKEDFDSELTSSINELGISHLFAVSGLHIGVMIIGINFVFSKMGLKEKQIIVITITILSLYLITTMFAPSITRASSMYAGTIVKKKYKIALSSIDILSIIFMIFMIYNPYSYFNIGFVLSFMMTFVILLGSKLLNVKGTFKQLFYVSLLAYFSSFVVSVNIAHSFNLLTILYNVLFVFLMSIIVLPLGMITFILPVLDTVYYYIIKIYNKLIFGAHKLPNIGLNIFIESKVIIMILAIIIFIIFLHVELNKDVKKLCIGYVIVILALYNISSIDPFQRIYFLDVDGDATFVSDSFSKCNILIDTGDNDDYDSVINFLISKSIKRLDYLIISHFHSDHYGEVEDIMERIAVSNVISSNNIRQYESNDMSCGDIDLYFYIMDYNSSNENDNSLIFSMMISGRHYLFMGDSEYRREKDFINEYNLNPDYLKVSHHGSITSSSSEFLDSINTRNAIIIVKRNNRNNHPSDEIIDRLNSRLVNIYRTDIHGTIEIKYFNNKEYKKYHSP